MGSSSFMQEAFLGGEISQSAQGRVSHPLYRMSLSIARNMIPVETGALHRRPGLRHCGFTRRGHAAKLISFDFQNSTPYQMEVRSSAIRFWADGELVTDNNVVAFTSISTGNPAVVTTTAQTWATDDTVVLENNNPLLQNRTFIMTRLSSTTFSIIDEIDDTPVNGATLGAILSGTARRITEIITPFSGETWRDVRSIQAETTAILVNGTQPQIMTVEALPSGGSFAEFSLAPSDFLDGPYLDPIKGSYITASAVSGVVTFTLSFQPYSASIAYDIGDYVTSASVGYRSLTAANQGNTPASSPTNWLPVNAGDPINGGAGFTSADIGRLIRVFSQPSLWAAGTTYAAGDIVTYSDQDDVPGYWHATGSVTGTKPGTTTLWAVVSGPSVALWTWARIRSISGAGLTVPDTAIGTLTSGGGLAAAFDGVPSKGYLSAANHSQTVTTYPGWIFAVWPLASIVQYQHVIYRLDSGAITGVGLINYSIPPPGYPFWTPIGATTDVSFDDYVGQHFTVATQIASVTVTPSSDVGSTNSSTYLAFNLRAKSTAPVSPSDGTLLGSTGSWPNGTTPFAIFSADQATAWNYVWVETIALFPQPLFDDGSHTFTCKLGVAQVQFFAPNVANGSVITAQIVGPALLYASTACRSWRLGVYGGTNGWPKSGTYSDGRLWLSGVIGNRIDSSKTNDIFNFAPTAPSGVVADDNAISAVFNATDVNAILWMHPEQQGIICGTQAGEWLVFAPGQGGISPTNIDAKRVTKIGCANIEPRRTDHTLVLVQKFQREIMEYFADVYSGKFSAPSVNERAKHMTVGGVQEIAYQQELTSIVWGRRGDGALIGTTYKRDSLTTSQGPNIAGAHQHSHGGGRQIISISVGGSQQGNLDALYVVTLGADGFHHVEIMTKLLDEGFALTDAWQVDDGIAPSSFAISIDPVAGAPYGGVTINGLWAHNGLTVQAWLVGLDCGVTTDADGNPTITDFLVANGSIFVPFGDGVSAGPGGGLFTQALVQPYHDSGLQLPGCVGFTFTSDGQIVRPATAPESGTRAGPGFAKLRRGQQFGMQLYGAINGSIHVGMEFDTVGTADSKMTPIDLRKKDGETAYTVLEPFNGITRAPVEASNDFDNMLAWRITRPVPAIVIAAGEFLHTQDI